MKFRRTVERAVQRNQYAESHTMTRARYRQGRDRGGMSHTSGDHAPVSSTRLAGRRASILELRCLPGLPMARWLALPIPRGEEVLSIVLSHLESLGKSGRASAVTLKPSQIVLPLPLRRIFGLEPPAKKFTLPVIVPLLVCLLLRHALQPECHSCAVRSRGTAW